VLLNLISQTIIDSHGGKFHSRRTSLSDSVDSFEYHVDSSEYHVDSSEYHVDSSEYHVDSSEYHVDSSEYHVDSSEYRFTRLNNTISTRLNTIFVDRTSSIPKAGSVAALHRKVRISAQL
jgi:hypothetical protein